MKSLPRLKPNVPLAKQAANVLRDYIKTDFLEGGILPGEHQLAERIGVNRGTLRQALNILEQEGLIIRRRGSGTYANPYVIGIKSRIDEGKEFQYLIRDAGYKPKTIQIALGQEHAPEDFAKRLGIETDSPVLISKQLLLANGDPAIYLVDAIPMSLIKEEFEAHEVTDSRFNFLFRRCHVQISYAIGEIIPRLCGTELSRILELKPWQPLLQVEDTSFDLENVPIMASRVCYRDSVIRFQVMTRLLY